MNSSKSTTCPQGELTIEYLGRVAQMLRLLAHPHRLKIVEMLEKGGSVPVHRITDGLGLSQGATSQHLNQMRRVGLVDSERKGREVRYRIADGRSVSILNCIRGQRRVGA